jgi:hypothetical protein
MSRITLSHPFSGVGLSSIISCGSISLPVTFGMSDNYHTESVVFNVALVNLPFNAILDRPVLDQFMAVVHYGYLVLKIPSPNGVIKVRGDRSTAISVLEKL